MPRDTGNGKLRASVRNASVADSIMSGSAAGSRRKRRSSRTPVFTEPISARPDAPLALAQPRRKSTNTAGFLSPFTFGTAITPDVYQPANDPFDDADPNMGDGYAPRSRLTRLSSIFMDDTPGAPHELYRSRRGSSVGRPLLEVMRTSHATSVASRRDGASVVSFVSDHEAVVGEPLATSTARAAQAEPPVPQHIQELRRIQRDKGTPTVWSHLVALMKKNALTKWRTPFSTLAELLLPIVFVCGLVVIWNMTTFGFVPDQQFAELPMASFTEPLVALCVDRTPSRAGQNAAVPGVRDCNATDLLSPSLTCNTNVPWIPVGLCSIVSARQVYEPFLKRFGIRRVVPTLDQLILMQWAYWLDSSLHSRTPTTVLFSSHEVSLSNSGMMYFSPKGPAADGMVEYFNRTSLLFKYINGGTVASASEIEERLTDKNVRWQDKRTLALIHLSAWSNSSFDVVYSFNRSGLPATGKIKNEYANGLGESIHAGQYVLSGFATVQAMVGRHYRPPRTRTVWDGIPLLYIESFGNSTAPPASVATAHQGEQLVIAPMPFTEHDASEFLTLVGDLAPLFLVFGYLYSVSQLTKKIVEEKESRMREAMMIMGLGTMSFYASWIATYLIIGTTGAAILCGITALTMLPKAMPVITFSLFFLFAASTVTLSSLLASFFSKSRVSALVAPVLFFAMAVPSFVLPTDSPIAVLLLLSLMSPTAFARGARHLFNHEKTTGSNGTNFTSDPDGYPMSLVLLMLIIDTVLYLLLALYLDAVLPSEWGTRRHPLFFLKAKCWPWSPTEQDHGNLDEDGLVKDSRDPHGEFEQVHQQDDPWGDVDDPSVRLLGLRKEFHTRAGHMTAVDDLTFDLYEDEITVLLGHNGAGKTTAINLMTGMLDVTAGDCTIYGVSVRDDIDKARQEIGLCPQHNILWDGLTCKEHLEFFARIKGCSGEDLDQATTAMLAAVDLTDKADVLSSGLSGGQKRKLSVAIAFVGGSKMVFLDEPTAGMDVGARRFTWDLIKQMSPGRTIVLTTHFMDEADLLGNAVAIMSKGSLKCAGSPVFLKSRLGVGYTLSLTCDKKADIAALHTLVTKYVEAAEVLSAAGGEISMRLPVSAVPSFPPLLSALETEGGRQGVRGHGLSITTLEEIFLRIGREHNTDLDPTSEHAKVEGSSEGRRDSVSTASFEAAWSEITDATTAGPAATQTQSAWSQAFALLMKRWHNAKRDRRTQVLQVILPTVCVLIALTLALVSITSSPDLRLDSSVYGTTDTAYTNCVAGFDRFRSPHTVADSAAVFVGTVAPAKNTSVDAAFWQSGVALSQHLLDTAKTHKHSRLTSFVCPSRSAAPGGPQRREAPFVMNNETGWLHSAAHAIHEYQAMHAKATLNDSSLAYRGMIRQLPLTNREAEVLDSLKSVLIGIFIMIPFTFIPSTFVAWIVKEKECKAKHMQIVCGMDNAVYWISNFAFDIVSFLFTTVLVIIIFLCFSRDEYVGDASTFFATFFLFFFYGVAAVCGSYLVSFAFTSHATAQNMVMIGNFVMGFLLVLATHALTLFPSTAHLSDIVPYAFRLWPAFCLGNGVISLAAGGVFSDAGSSTYSPWQMKVTGWNIVYLAAEAPLFLALTLLIDHPTLLTTLWSRGILAGPTPDPPSDEDADVSEERHAIDKKDSERAAGDSVVVKSLRQVYAAKGGDKVAVRNLTFGVKQAEVFGFLGTNGAGKTTTMSVLAGEMAPTAGHAWVAGKDVVADAADARKALGYCPQFDALLDLLTVEEHLELYAGLRGIHGDARTAVVEALLVACGLLPYRSKETRALSGGNKRKLSVAIALVGGPQVVLLDEPSAGMDPMARRALWDVLEVVAKHCSIVLTTHHLEEVEALASRVTIMDQGEMKCLGSLQHLKTTLGSGFEMFLRVPDEADADAADHFIEKAVPNAVLQESRNRKLTYSLPPSTQLSQVFEVLEGHKRSLRVTDYSVSQTSLESVFLKISNAGRDVDDHTHGST